MMLDIANTDLCSYADRECADDEVRRIVTALAASPQLNDRLDLWRRNDASLRLALAALEATPSRNVVRTGRAAPLTLERAAPSRPCATSRLRATTLVAIAGGSGFAALAFATLIFVGR